MRVFIPITCVFLSFVLFASCTSETETTNGEGGAGGGGTAGTGGTAGDGGSAGHGGGAGDGGGPGECGADFDCSNSSECSSAIQALCGGIEMLDTVFCGADSKCVVVCTSGPCDRSDCVPVETCTPGEEGDQACAERGADVCQDRGGFRDAECFDWGPNGSWCDWVCGDGVAGCLPPT